jgi:outer membrane protein OmpA-like peptidoglycan-associated protein
MIPTGYKYAGLERPTDGYTGATSRPENNPRPVVVEYSLGQTVPKAALLRMFIDDFQSPVFHTTFQATLNGERAPFLERQLNAVQQTGPIGKLITVEIPPEYMRLLSAGKLTIAIDDAVSDTGDGFAIDFVELLINPRKLRHVGTVFGTVTNKETGQPIEGAVVSAGGAASVTTGKTGQYSLPDVAAGLAIATASRTGFDAASKADDLVSGEKVQIDLELEPARQETAGNIGETLEKTRRAVLYGIRFDSSSAVPRPESAATLQQLLDLLRARPTLGLVVEGHTDSQNTEEFNQTLSQNRAKAIVDWLAKNGIAASRLRPVGYGESRPVADNRTAEGRALNRRVEVEATSAVK